MKPTATTLEHYKHLASLIDRQRIMNTIEKLGAITESPHEGVTRLAYSDLDIQAKNIVAHVMKDAGLTTEVSPIGNILGRLAPEYYMA